MKNIHSQVFFYLKNLFSRTNFLNEALLIELYIFENVKVKII